MEGETERFVSLFATLATIKQVLLDVVQDREKSTARRVGRSVLAVGASNALGESSCPSRSVSPQKRAEAETHTVGNSKERREKDDVEHLHKCLGCLS